MSDGGQAFPAPAGHYNSEGDWVPTEGMTLRDYFAAAALTGIISQALPEQTTDDQAAWAYAIADALLKAREP